MTLSIGVVATWTWLHSPTFRATPLDVKAEADIHFLQGINQLIGHGWPYSAPGVEYPGWRFYAAAVFNENNPWWIVMGFAGRHTSDPVSVSLADLDKASGKTFAAMVKAHTLDYQRYFNRVSLRLGADNVGQSFLTTPQRLKAFGDGSKDPGLSALYFQYGRYLLISSSRPGGLPANLQGIWAEEVQTPWNADWHLNVNVQMNYWPAEVTNLSDLHQPLFALIESLQEPGARTAKLYYNARGWVAHVITNPWRFGGEMRIYREDDSFKSNQQSGQFIFDNTFTRTGSASTADVEGIQGFAAFLLGYPTTMQIVRASDYSEYSKT